MVIGADHWLAAAAPAATARFAVIGDYGSAVFPEEGQVATMIHSWSPDLIITVGDNNYEDGFAADIGRARYTRASRTSISSALLFAAPLFEGSGFRGVRRVIDVSGDGVNNNGPLMTPTRDEVLAKGITINGLPILLKRPNASTLDIEQLDIYYEDCVIGGPGAFVIPIKEREQFKEAIRTKLVLEIAGRTPARRIVPVSAAVPRISCTIGERLWQERWGN